MCATTAAITAMVAIFMSTIYTLFVVGKRDKRLQRQIDDLKRELEEVKRKE